MNEYNFTIALIIVEIIFSIMVLSALRKAGARRDVLGVLGTVFLAWFGAAYYMVSHGMFSATGSPQIVFTVAVMIPVILGLLAQKYWKPFDEAIGNMPTETLLSLQQMRAAFGLMFFFTSALPVWFQYVGGLGDIAAGIGAFFALSYLRKNPDQERRAIIEGNLVGILDFIIVLNLGVLVVLDGHSPDITFNLIPIYVVPTFILLHIFSLQKLKKPVHNFGNQISA
ncbi:MAG: hypothetical protein BMS9Abin33_0598 [Gammaproteobacteria bacterium]|nr:MAG: hypothetical protein BMS9Abin33_0598 [Gammaproteobacteria bacterium]